MRLDNSDVVEYRRLAGCLRNEGSIPIHWVQELKWPGREADHTPSSSATLPKSTVRGAIPLISHMLSWRSVSVRTGTHLPKFIIVIIIIIIIIIIISQVPII